MTRDDVIDLLKVIAAYDRRTVGEADVLAWSEQARRGRWLRDEVLEVVHEHYAQSREMIATADVALAVRVGRRTEFDRAYVPGQCADPELHARLEAFADRKAVDAPRGPVPLPPAQRDRRPRSSGHAISEAMAKGARARAAHAATEQAAADLDAEATP